MASVKRCSLCGRNYSSSAVRCDCQTQAVMTMTLNPPEIHPAPPASLTLGAAVRFVLPGGTAWHTGTITREPFEKLDSTDLKIKQVVFAKITAGTYANCTMQVPVTNVELLPEERHESI